MKPPKGWDYLFRRCPRCGEIIRPYIRKCDRCGQLVKTIAYHGSTKIVINEMKR
jgi:uncharacterized OB-fold protein